MIARLKRHVSVERDVFTLGIGFALLEPEGPAMAFGLGRLSIVLYWRAQ